MYTNSAKPQLNIELAIQNSHALPSTTFGLSGLFLCYNKSSVDPVVVYYITAPVQSFLSVRIVPATLKVCSLRSQRLLASLAELALRASGRATDCG